MPGPNGAPPAGLALPGAPTPGQVSGSYPTTTDPGTGTFDPNASASTTDPGGNVTTDVYGLTTTEQQWTFFNGIQGGPGFELPNGSPQARKNADEQGQINDHSNVGQTNWQTAEQIMKGYSGLASSNQMSDRQTWANVQRQLLTIGAYGNSGNANLYRPGVWTSNDAQALITAMRSYQQVSGVGSAGTPLTFSEWLDQASGMSAANGYDHPGGPGSSTPAPTPIALTNPDYLTRYAQMAAQNALGRMLKPDELNAFIDQFHQQELDAGTGKNAVKRTDGSYSQIGPSDARSAAVNYVLQNDQQEFGQHEIQGYTNAFLNMFLPNAAARPNTPVDPYSIGY